MVKIKKEDIPASVPPTETKTGDPVDTLIHKNKPVKEKGAAAPFSDNEDNLKFTIEQEAQDNGSVERDRKEFFANTVIGIKDVGKTLLSYIDEVTTSADQVTELSSTEQQYLDDLLFNGFVTHRMYLRDELPVVFRSVPAIANQRGNDLLSGKKGNKDKLGSLFSCMVVAVYLQSYGNYEKGKLHFSHTAKNAKEFESEEAIEERFEFVNEKMPDVVVDVLLQRLREFLDLLKRIALSKNIINF